jgi:tetratricopeptide (TPR) repeat protein
MHTGSSAPRAAGVRRAWGWNALLPALLSLGLGLTALAGRASCAPNCEYSADMPERIVSWRERILPPERYQALVKEWQRYVDTHPREALGYVYLWRAKRYAQAGGHDEGVRLMEKAYGLDPNCAEVLNDLSSLEFGKAERDLGDFSRTRELAERAIALRPDWPEPHINLLTLALRTGDSAGQAAQLQALARKGAFAPQLLDFAHNLLVSARPGAIILTNGDNDTYPPLAMQRVFGQRTDVAIVNLSLLNLRTYSKAVLAGDAKRPGPFTAMEIEALQAQARDAKQPPMHSIVRALVQKIATGSWTGPVSFACTVYPGTLQEVCTQPLIQEGLLFRVAAGKQPKERRSDEIPVNAARTDSLLSRDFRLQSATQFGYAWDPESAVAMLQWNYISTWQRTATAYAEAGNLQAAGRMLRAAVEMLRAHPELRGSERDYLGRILDYWKEIDPGNRDLEAIRRELEKERHGREG